jgi:small-conductance mechanosensitive channel/CRP-like cAMP-binding protein
VIDSSTFWAIIVMVVVPATIIAASEVDERLRQRESPLRGAADVLRRWAIPFFAIWVILVPLLSRDNESFVVRTVATGLILALAIVARRVLKVVIDGIRERPNTDGRGSVPQLLLAVPRILLILIVGWVLLNGVWGVDLSAVLTALGVTSLVVSFALQDTLSGLASGMLLLSDKPFEPGDWINAGDNEGLVIDINWRTSRIRTRDGDVIIVPNSELAGAAVTNYSSPERLHRVVVSLQVAYVNPPTTAKEMLLDTARSIPGVLTDPPPLVRVVSIDDPLMGYDVQMWVDDYAIVPRVKSDFGSLVWYQSHRHEVPLPSPAQDLFIHDVAAEAEAAKPNPADIRRGLQRSPLLAMLEDTQIDSLVRETRPARYAVGELMIDSQSERHELMVMVEGRALLVLIEVGYDETVIGEIGAGEALGLLEGPRGEGRMLALRAVTDCEVLVVNAEAASGIGSRNAELAAAFNRMTAVRHRRVERVIAARSTDGEAKGDEATAISQSANTSAEPSPEEPPPAESSS